MNKPFDLPDLEELQVAYAQRSYSIVCLLLFTSCSSPTVSSF